MGPLTLEGALSLFLLPPTRASPRALRLALLCFALLCFALRGAEREERGEGRWEGDRKRFAPKAGALPLPAWPWRAAGQGRATGGSRCPASWGWARWGPLGLCPFPGLLGITVGRG